jgi:hypothetical protein
VRVPDERYSSSDFENTHHIHLTETIRTLSGWLTTNHGTYPVPVDGENSTPIEDSRTGKVPPL